MRELISMYNNLVDNGTKQYEAKKFVDSAIKGAVEQQLETLARALSGSYKIHLEKSSINKPFEITNHIKTDEGKYVKKTLTYKYRARIDCYCVHAQTRIGIWLAVIGFWTEDQTLYPCGWAGCDPYKEQENP